MKWFFYVIPSFFFTALCYATNWAVTPFADKDGELHGFLKYWQTWDNSLNPSDLLKILPDWLTDWYEGHYEEYYSTDEELTELGRGRWYTTCINDNFTILQRVKRYICRTYWIYRNSAYGFCFLLLGVDFNPYHEFYVKEEDGERFVRDLDDTEVWMYSNSRRIFWRLYWNVFLGWKLAIDSKQITRCMIANRIAFKIQDK